MSEQSLDQKLSQKAYANGNDTAFAATFNFAAGIEVHYGMSKRELMAALIMAAGEGISATTAVRRANDLLLALETP